MKASTDSDRLVEKLNEAKNKILSICAPFPKLLVVLGSGLGGVVDELSVEIELPYSEIPHFRTSTVAGHNGRLAVGKLRGRLAGHPIAVMHGRLHYYEGYSIDEVVFPVRAFAYAGAESFLLTNAAGALRADLIPGELVLIRDHLNLMGTNPLLGPNCAGLGPRFLDMGQAYDPRLCDLIQRSAESSGSRLREGVYIALSGPCYETPSEVRMYQMLGGDVIGMSTVPEAIALRHMGKQVAAISCVTNLAAGVGGETVTHDDVLKTASFAQHGFVKLIEGVIQRL